MRRILSLGSIIAVLALSTPVAFAVANAPTGISIQNPIGGQDQQLGDIIKKVTDGIRNLSIPVAVVMILWAGFNYLTAAGNPAKITKGNTILKYTAIGLVIIFIGGGFVDLIKSVLGTK